MDKRAGAKQRITGKCPVGLTFFMIVFMMSSEVRIWMGAAIGLPTPM
jgi:hypothetical protein